MDTVVSPFLSFIDENPGLPSSDRDRYVDTIARACAELVARGRPPSRVDHATFVRINAQNVDRGWYRLNDCLSGPGFIGLVVHDEIGRPDATVAGRLCELDGGSLRSALADYSLVRPVPRAGEGFAGVPGTDAQLEALRGRGFFFGGMWRARDPGCPPPRDTIPLLRALSRLMFALALGRYDPAWMTALLAPEIHGNEDPGSDVVRGIGRYYGFARLGPPLVWKEEQPGRDLPVRPALTTRAAADALLEAFRVSADWPVLPRALEDAGPAEEVTARPGRSPDGIGPGRPVAASGPTPGPTVSRGA